MLEDLLTLQAIGALRGRASGQRHPGGGGHPVPRGVPPEGRLVLTGRALAVYLVLDHGDAVELRAAPERQTEREGTDQDSGAEDIEEMTFQVFNYGSLKAQEYENLKKIQNCRYHRDFQPFLTVWVIPGLVQHVHCCPTCTETPLKITENQFGSFNRAENLSLALNQIRASQEEVDTGGFPSLHLPPISEDLLDGQGPRCHFMQH